MNLNYVTIDRLVYDKLKKTRKLNKFITKAVTKGKSATIDKVEYINDIVFVFLRFL